MQWPGKVLEGSEEQAGGHVGNWYPHDDVMQTHPSLPLNPATATVTMDTGLWDVCPCCGMKPDVPLSRCRIRRHPFLPNMGPVSWVWFIYVGLNSWEAWEGAAFLGSKTQEQNCPNLGRMFKRCWVNSTSECIPPKQKQELEQVFVRPLLIATLFTVAKTGKNPMSIDQWMARQNVVHLYNGLCLSLKRGMTFWHVLQHKWALKTF